MNQRDLDAMAHAECQAIEAQAEGDHDTATQHFRDAMEHAFLAGWPEAAQRLRLRERQAAEQMEKA